MKNTDNAIKSRITQKVLADEAWNISLDQTSQNTLIQELLDLAATAPYHYACHESHSTGELSSALPYRFYVLDTNNIRSLAHYIKEEKLSAGKILNMLEAADLLFLVTWLPEPSKNEEAILFEGNIKNMEHIAAASAAIQNVLIGASAREIPNYWSSGGVLKQASLKSHLNIPMQEILLGAIFLFPKDSENKKGKIVEGKLRNTGKEKSTWAKNIEIS